MNSKFSLALSLKYMTRKSFFQAQLSLEKEPIPLTNSHKTSQITSSIEPLETSNHRYPLYAQNHQKTKQWIDQCRTLASLFLNISMIYYWVCVEIFRSKSTKGLENINFIGSSEGFKGEKLRAA